MESIFSGMISKFVERIGMVSNYLDMKPYGEVRDIMAKNKLQTELELKTWFYNIVDKFVNDTYDAEFDYKALDECYDRYIHNMVRKRVKSPVSPIKGVNPAHVRLSDLDALAALKKKMEEGL